MLITIEHPTFPCYIIERNVGASFLCGYIAVPPGHPWHGKFYDDIDPQVHGGLTYAYNALHADDRAVPIPIGSWILGFDCAHSGDGLYPGDGERRSEAYVRAELESLRTQAQEASA